MQCKSECQGGKSAFKRCFRKPTIERQGKAYCWQHDPERVRKIAAEAWTKRKADIARIEADQDARIARKKLIEAAGVGVLSDDDLKAIADLGGIQAILKQARPKP